MKFVYDDGGREAAGYKGSAGDCVVRAVAIAAELPYQIVYDALSEGMRTQRTGRVARRASARSGVSTTRKWFKDYMVSIGFTWTPTMSIGSGCKVHLHDGELPAGRLVVRVSKHCTAVIDGVVHDTYDPQWATVWSKEDGTNGISRRCVYGYWGAAHAAL